MLEKRKVIIDTDIGDDIDDLLALLYLLNSRDIEIIGIISAYQNTARRAKQISKVLSLVGREDIPVYAGYGIPLKGKHFISTNESFTQDEEDLSQSKYHYLNENEGSLGKAGISFLLEQARQHQQNLAILAIGPLTNIALAIKEEPTLLAKIPTFIMGGCFFSKKSEWNMECDEEAAKIVFANQEVLYIAGLDVTEKTLLSEEELRPLLEGEQAIDKYRAWAIYRWQSLTRRSVTLHDPLAVYTLRYASSLNFKEGKIKIDGGFTSLKEGKGHHVLTKFDRTNFLNDFYKHILGG